MNFFQDSQKNDTMEKIESSKRTNWFIIKNKQGAFNRKGALKRKWALI